MRDELERIKERNPGIDHREAFKQAAANWSQSPTKKKKVWPVGGPSEFTTASQSYDNTSAGAGPLTPSSTAADVPAAAAGGMPIGATVPSTARQLMQDTARAMSAQLAALEHRKAADEHVDGARQVPIIPPAPVPFAGAGQHQELPPAPGGVDISEGAVEGPAAEETGLPDAVEGAPAEETGAQLIAEGNPTDAPAEEAPAEAPAIAAGVQAPVKAALSTLAPSTATSSKEASAEGRRSSRHRA
jgi:hypothetical protein